MIKITWLYYDLLDLYADIGNVLVLEDIFKQNSISYQVDKVTIDDEYDLRDSDIILLGGGADFEQSIVFNDLLKRKQNLMQAILNDTVILAICGGYQLLGKYYLDADGNKIPGLNLFEFYTEAEITKERMVGYLKITANILNQEIDIVGFENHSGATKNVENILGNVVFGYGNNHEEKKEGLHYKNVFGTYLHGPVLTRNREFALSLAQLAINKNNIDKSLVYENKFMDKSKEELYKYIEEGKFK